MKITSLKNIIIMILCISVAYLSGCSSNINLIKMDMYKLHEISTSDFALEFNKIYTENSTFVISGKLKRTNLIIPYSGHVDIVIVDPDGKLFEQLSVKNKLPHMRIAKRRYSSFEAKIQKVPPRGSTIRAIFHQTTNSFANEKDYFDCGDNAAKQK